jgi:hypothetical protein
MKPNLIIFVSHQWRGDFTGSADHPDVRTPNYDRMAEEGMVFNRPVQNSVSRSMILCLYPRPSNSSADRRGFRNSATECGVAGL